MGLIELKESLKKLSLSYYKKRITVVNKSENSIWLYCPPLKKLLMRLWLTRVLALVGNELIHICVFIHGIIRDKRRTNEKARRDNLESSDKTIMTRAQFLTGHMV